MTQRPLKEELVFIRQGDRVRVTPHGPFQDTFVGTFKQANLPIDTWFTTGIVVQDDGRERVYDSSCHRIEKIDTIL